MKKLNNKGFSLVELIIVIAIMAILVGVMAPSLMKYIEKSRYSSDVQTIDNAYSALKYAMADEGAYQAALGNAALTGASGVDFATILAGSDKLSTEVKDVFGASTYTFKSKAFAAGSGTQSAIMVKMDANGEFVITVTSKDSKYDSVSLPKGTTSGATP